jgi:adenosylcobinamide kinase / adenosylcobinamide-phosphate guanylyltransferase
MGDLILITGGVRSGKSRFAEQLAREAGGDRVAYVATAEAGDDEMRARIAAHRLDRPSSWRTIENPTDVARAIDGASAESPHVILVDCLTMLVSNLLLSGDESTAAERVDRQVDAIRAACRRSAATVIIVTNEVGWGVVPPSSLGRRYRDLLGTANQALASNATKVFILIAGIAVDCKAIASATLGVSPPAPLTDREIQP